SLTRATGQDPLALALLLPKHFQHHRQQEVGDLAMAARIGMTLVRGPLAEIAALRHSPRPALEMIHQRRLRLASRLATDANVLLQAHVRMLACAVETRLLAPARRRHQNWPGACLAHLGHQLAEVLAVLLCGDSAILLTAINIAVVG